MKFKSLYMTEELYNEMYTKELILNLSKGVKLKFIGDGTCKLLYHNDSKIAFKVQFLDRFYLVKKKNGKYKLSTNSDKYKATNTKCMCIWETVSLTII